MAISAGSAARGAALPETQLILEQWNGAAWTEAPAQTPHGGSSLSAIAALSRTNAWAVGSWVKTPLAGGIHWYPLAEHWNGSLWQPVTMASPTRTASEPTDLVGVAASSARDVWAVGSFVRRDLTGGSLIEHWSGHSWRIVSSPSRFSPAGVAAVSSHAAWAVGSYPGPKGRARTGIVRWNGSSWRRVGSPNPSGRSGYDELLAVSASSARNAWAVGDYKRGLNVHTLVLHWNGKHWTRAASPSPGSRRLSTLHGVVADGRRDAWAVGAYRPNKTVQAPLVEHWNGRRWRVVPAPSAAGSSFHLLEAAAADSPRDVWAVGQQAGPSQILVEHWDGSTWKIVPASNPGLVDSLSGVAAVSASSAWAVGVLDNP